jgi:cellulose synthase/poly-beta-1,6-N-acetylglucosamine synthase-like glycosyltransferase
MDSSWQSLLWIFSYTIVVVGLSLYGIHRYSMIFLFWKHRKDRPQPKAKFAELPAITVQLPIFNELHVVKRLVRKVAELEYPKHLLQIQILDDSTDETAGISQAEAEALQKEGFQVEYIHRTDRTGFKAGALENGMRSATGELIFILDADFVPPKSVLMDMVHFFTDDEIALVQTRWGHINRNYSLLTKIQAMFLDGHLVIEQTARSRAGRFFNFNGTAGMWRKSAIIDAGGWEHDTLTEDLDLSYRAQMKGWRFVFLLDVETPAELPVDMDGFKSQQHRWTKGSVQTCKKLLGSVWKNEKIPFMLKLESTAHLTSNFAYLFLVFLCFLVWPDMSNAGTEVPSTLAEWRVWLLDIPIFLLTTGSVCLFYITAQRALFPKTWLREIVYLPALLALGVGMSINNGKAVLEAIFNHDTPFIRTPKYGIEKRGESWRRKGRYKAMKSVARCLEIGLACYFTMLVIFAVLRNDWSSVPFLVLFMLGFWFVALGTLPSRNESTPSQSLTA